VTVTRASASIQLVVSYIVLNASWRPVYDLRVSRSARRMNVSYNAMVKQSTGEPWNDVRVTLSSAKPHTSGEPPAMSTWFISKYVPRYYGGYGDMECLQEQCDMVLEAKSMSRTRGASMRNVMQQMMPMQSAALSAADVRPAYRPPAVQSAQVAAGTTAAYTIAASTTIACDNEPVRVTISQFDLGVGFRYSAVPKIDPHTYLKVKAVNSSPFLLLPGSANVFADQEFVCKTEMSLVAPREEFWTFLGVDEDIKVTRSVVHQKATETSGMISGKRVKVEYYHKFSCVSAKATVEELVVWDQVPITEDKKLTITLVHPSATDVPKPPKFDVNDLQFVEWFLTMKPNEEQQFDFVYSAKHDAEYMMVC
jgi:uncharacterized protein (TIGR02231 family)